MKLTINRQILLKALTLTLEAIPQKTVTPVLSNFFIELNENGLLVFASDSTISIKETIEFKDGEKDNITGYEFGVVLVQARYLTDIIRQIEGELVHLETIDNTMLHLDDGKTEYNLRCSEANEYPDIEKGDPNSLEAIELSKEDFSKLVKSTSYAVATKPGRPVLNGENIRLLGNVLSFTANDSFRMARKSINVTSDFNFNYTVPVKVLNLLANLEAVDKILMSFEKNRAVFKSSNLVIGTRLIDGEYPAVDRIIQTSYQCSMQVNSKELIGALTRIALVAQEKSNIVRFIGSSEACQLSCKSQTIGTSKEDLQSAKFFGERFEICFNVFYVIDAVKALESDIVELTFNGESPVFSVRSTDETAVQIITRVRMQD